MDNDRFEWVNESCKNMHLFEQYNKVYNQVLDYLTERGITTRNIHIAVEEPKPREVESASPCFSCQSADDEPQILCARAPDKQEEEAYRRNLKRERKALLKGEQFIVSPGLFAQLKDRLDHTEYNVALGNYVYDLVAQRRLKMTDVYNKANLSRQHFNKIINQDNYQPQKNTMLALALGLGLTVPEAQELLAQAGYVLQEHEKRDLIVRFCLEHHIFNVIVVNSLLDDFGEEPLN